MIGPSHDLDWLILVLSNAQITTKNKNFDLKILSGASFWLCSTSLLKSSIEFSFCSRKVDRYLKYFVLDLGAIGIEVWDFVLIRISVYCIFIALYKYKSHI